MSSLGELKMKKIKIDIIFGGKSVEHEVSLQSAASIANVIDKSKYKIYPVYIDQNGNWFLLPSIFTLVEAADKIPEEYQKLGIETGIVIRKNTAWLIDLNMPETKTNIDLIFPVLHGTHGEDGSIQGLAKMYNLPCVGTGILGSAVSMDKDISKRLLRDAGINVAEFKVFNKFDRHMINYKEIIEKFGVPVFIKPANAGSSVGISKVYNETDFCKALDVAFRFDNKIIIEKFIMGFEIECSVLGYKNPLVSVAGEVKPKKGNGSSGFYSYEAKYIDKNGATLKIPAQLPEDILTKVRDLSLKAYKVLACNGMARVDSFVTDDYTIYINEINTIPGFTNISMYPKLFEATGIKYAELVDMLVTIAIRRFNDENLLKTTI